MPKNMIEIWAPVLTAPVSAVAHHETNTRFKTDGPISISAKETSRHAASSSVGSKKTGASGLGASISEAVSGKFGVYTVPMSELTGNLKQTLSNFQQVIDGLPKPASGYCIDEIELHLGVNGNGGIALIGKLTVGMEAAIKVKIRRLP